MSAKNSTANSSLAHRFADKLRRDAVSLTRIWVDALDRRLEDVPARRVFPTESLLNHIPVVLAHLSDYLELDEDALEDPFVHEDLRKLAALRRQQGYDLDEIQAEFSILSRLLFGAAREFVEETEEVDARDLVNVLERLQHAIRGIATITALAYGESALEERKQRARILERFGQVISHEIRNRLNLARLAVEGWRRARHPTSEDLDLLQTLGTALKGIESVAEDVRGLSVAQVIPDSKWGRRRDLDDVLERLVEVCRPLTREHGVDLVVEGDPPATAVEASQLELAMVNLIVNGAKYRDPKAEQPRITLSAAACDDELVIKIVDNGTGIPESLRGRLFESGTRGDNTTDDDVPGEGLGLSIARDAIDQIGGTVRLDPEHEAPGCAFVITLPTPNALVD